MLPVILYLLPGLGNVQHIRNWEQLCIEVFSRKQQGSSAHPFDCR